MEAGRGGRARIPLSAEEHRKLHDLAERNLDLALRIHVILASAQGEAIDSIAAATGMSKASVWFWRKRFRDRGILGLAPKDILLITETEQRELDELQASSDERVSARAKLLLDVARTADIAAAARQARIAVATARGWISDFKRSGVGCLNRRRKSRSATCLRQLTAEELTLLSGWSKVQSRASAMATAILAMAGGESVISVAARLGRSRDTVESWRRRFLARGLAAIADRSLVLTPEQHEDLEQLRGSELPEVEKRAAILLDLVRTGSIDRTAKAARVAPATVKRVRTAFNQLGAVGVATPRYALRRSAEAFNSTLRLNAELRVRVSVGETLTLRGQTTTITSRRASIALYERLRVPKELVGRIISGEIDWPATRDGKAVVLSVGGDIVAADPDAIEIRLHQADLRHASARLDP